MNAVTSEHKTCLVTIITPGQSDKVIKVYPAEHESEKIWLNNTQGIERWELVKRLMFNDAERGTRVPDPSPYHEGRDLKTVVLKEEDIPLVRLSSQVLKRPPEPDQIKLPDARQSSAAEINERFSRLERTVGDLATAMSTLASVLAPKIVDRPQPVQPVQAVASTDEWQCNCGQKFDNAHGLKIHTSKAHKK